MNINDIVIVQNSWWIEPDLPASTLGYRRPMQQTVYQHLVDVEHRRAVLVRGARQVGKTTILLQTIDQLLADGWPPQNILYFDFSDDRILGELSIDQVVQVVPTGMQESYPRMLLLDEICHAPNWDRWLKRAVDEGQGRIVATNSSSSLLRLGSMESGLGRWDDIILEGLSFREFAVLSTGEDLDPEDVIARNPRLLEIYLRIGGFPEHARGEDFQEIYRKIREDIAGKAVLRDLLRYGMDLSGAKDLFVYLAQNSGLIFNARGIGKEIERDRRSISDWVQLLEDTLLICLRGRVFEAVVFRHLREIAKDIRKSLFFHRDPKGEECDFLLIAEDKTYGIEVTAAREPSGTKIGSLRRLAKNLGWDGTIMIHGGLSNQELDGIQMLPLREFLIHPTRFLERVT